MKIKFTILCCIIFLLFSQHLFPQNYSTKTKTGIDILIESNFNILKGQKIILLTNHAGRTNTGESSVEAFLKSSNCKLTALFTPEHGYYTTIPAGKHVSNEMIFNIPVFSLYGKNRKPSREHLQNCDAVVIDLQDIGIRSYTYLSTMYNTMDVAAELNIPVYVLDRPNPLGGLIIDGNTVEQGYESFVGIIPVSYIHGCTFGELATMINEEGWLQKDSSDNPRKCDLTVIKMENWKRWMVWEDTGLIWFPTSPHIPTVNAIRGAAVLGIFGELSVISIGIGTTLPFQYIGSPELNSKAIEAELGTLNFQGLTLTHSKYRPFYGMFKGKDCYGFLMTFPLNNLFAPYTTGIEIMLAIKKVYPHLFLESAIKDKSRKMFIKVTGSSELFEAIFIDNDKSEIFKIANKGIRKYMEIRAKYLLYD